MMRLSVLSSVLTLFLAACNTKGQHLRLVQTISLPSYPSGSVVVYKEGRYFVAGDDAADLLVLDSTFKNSVTLNLVPFQGKRMPKSKKADLEAGTWFKDKNEEGLLLMGSGSLAPHRNSGWIVKPFQDAKRTFRLDTFYDRLQQAGIRQLNIEGVAQLPGWYVIACRGNISYKKNHLVFARHRFWDNQAKVQFHVALLGGNEAGKPFSGVSGMDYSYRSDRLFLTASTEHTSSVSGDGEIGKSYMWIIRSMNRMVNYEAVNPFEIIDLEKEDKRFKGEKIESVSVVSETKDETGLILVSDNDNGKTTLFHVIVKHKKVEQP